MNSVTVTRRWDRETIVLVGGGPSLTPDDVSYCRGIAKVIGTNDAYMLAPWADLLYAPDGPWWDYHIPRMNGCFSERWTCNKAAADKYSLNFIELVDSPGLSECNRYIYNAPPGRNAGFQVLNLAVLFGAKRLILLGYDMKRKYDAQGRNEKSHWFGDHPGKLNKRSNYPDFIAHFEKAVPQLQRLGVDVINCSRETALSCFRRESLIDALH